jgi:hypothetical protein
LSIAIPNCVFFDVALSLIAAPIRCTEVILYDELLFYVSVSFNLIKALSTTFAPNE